MPITYQLEEAIKKLTAKNNAGPALKRLSDCRVAVYAGGRTSNETTYLKGQNADAAGVNAHWTDAWDTFAGARGVTGETRPDQKRRLFFVSQNYP